MPPPNVHNRDDPMPAYRGIREITLSTDDETFDSPVTIQVVDAGNLSYEDSLDRTHNLTGLSAGDNVVGPGNGLVFVSRIIAGTDTTVTEVIAGIY